MLTAVLTVLAQNGVTGAVAVLFLVLYVRKDRQVERTYATLLSKVLEVTTAWKEMSQEMEKLLRERRQADLANLNSATPAAADETESQTEPSHHER